MRISRILTALIVTVMCVLVMAMGLEIVWFSVATTKTGPANANIYRQWVDIPGIKFSARAHVLTVVANSGAPRNDSKLLEAVSKILAVKPVSAGYWLSLARVRWNSGQGSDKVQEAWSLSVLTGPNEGNVLPWRGLFGLSLWDRFGTGVNHQTIADLGTALPRITAQQELIGRALLANKPKEVRHEIRSLFLAEGTSESDLAKIGLQ